MSDERPDDTPADRRRRMVIAVCGSGAEDQRLNALAEAVGALLAARGAVLI